MTIDEAILKALQGGPVTVDAILKRFEGPVRGKLEKLRVRGVVMREGRGGRTEGSLSHCYAPTALRRRLGRREGAPKAAC